MLLIATSLTASAQQPSPADSTQPNFSPESTKIIDHFLSAGGSCVAVMGGWPEVDTMAKDDKGHIIFTHAAIFAGGREYDRQPVGYLTDAKWSPEARVIAQGSPLYAQMVGNGGVTWTWKLAIEGGTVKALAGQYDVPYTKCGTRADMVAYAKTLS
jgi:hypothetical protein